MAGPDALSDASALPPLVPDAVGDATPLPVLRPELRLEPAAPEPGRPASWRLIDPLRQRFFLVTDADRQLLALWDAGTLGGLRRTAAVHGVRWDAAQAQALLAFLRQHQLVQPRPGQTAALVAQARAARPQGWRGWLSRFMGWQLPLCQPQGFLLATLPWVRWLWSWPVITLWALATGLGLYLVGRQWDSFTHTFTAYLTPAGLLWTALALVALKVVHELGHAYACVHHGAQVGSMGVSLVMLAPMLYTDTSDAARLDSRRARLWIDAAGVLTESLVAGLATLAWAVLPDGPLRGVCFVLATASWLTSLAVNLNPLSRFDGYYLLSDFLRLPNLQTRALAYAGWLLGRTLLGAVEPAPEPVTRARALLFTVYGSAVWVYRIGLSLAAAWLAYTWLFKAAGVALAVVELWVFVGRPLGQRLARWWQLRGDVAPLRWLVLLAGGAALVSALVMPLDHRVGVPAVLAWQQQTVLQAPEVSQIEAVLVQPGQQVRTGQLLLQLRSPELMRQIASARANEVLTLQRLDRLSGDVRDLAQAQVLQQQRREVAAELAGLREREARLLIRASADGRLADLPPTLQAGQWVRPDRVLGRVLHGQAVDAQGLVASIDLPRLRPGARARFIADDITVPPLPLQLVALETHSAELVTPDALSSLHGGPVPSVADRQGRSVPVGAWHRLGFSVDASPAGSRPLDQLLRGHVVVDATPDSLLRQAGRRLWRLLIAEAAG